MFMNDTDTPDPISIEWPMKIALYIGVIAIVVIGIWQKPLLDLATGAAKVFAFN